MTRDQLIEAARAQLASTDPTDGYLAADHLAQGILDVLPDTIEDQKIVDAVRRWTGHDGTPDPHKHGNLYEAWRQYCEARGDAPSRLEDAAHGFAERSIARGIAPRWRTDEPPRGVRCLVTARTIDGIESGVLIATVSPDHDGTVWFCNGTRLYNVIAWLPCPEPARV